MINHEIDLPLSGNKIGFNLLDNADFTITYVIYTIPNSPAGYQLPTQSNKICGSFLSMNKVTSHTRKHFMNSSTITINTVNPRSR